MKMSPNALQSGVVDGAENPWVNIWSAKFFEIQDGVTETNHGAMGYVLLASTDFLGGLPDDIRTELRSIIDDGTVYERKIAGEKTRLHVSLFWMRAVWSPTCQGPDHDIGSNT